MSTTPVLYVLSTESSAASDEAVCKFAQFLGLQTKLVSLHGKQMERPEALGETAPGERVLALGYLVLSLLAQRDWWASLLDETRFSFVYGFATADGEWPELKRLTSNAITSVSLLAKGTKLVRVHADVTYGNFPVSGQCYSEACGHGAAFEHHPEFGNLETYISVNDRPYFLSIPRRGNTLFFLAENSLVDIDTELSPETSLRPWYAQLTAMAIFLRVSCGSHCWTAPVTPASFIVDDPYLKRRYGFIHYETLLGALETTQSALTIAFIPYNYRRSEPKTVALLRRQRERFSLAVHGCDHTGGEFASLDESWLERAAGCALQRMEIHQDLTGMPFDKIMVFPQGRFSTAAIRGLKKCGYLAAVNTTAWPVDPGAKPLKIRDLLDVAVMCYESFPIFVRRYPRDVFDYAFDALFQKPILAVEHHDYFRDGYGPFSGIVEKLSALRTKPVWMPLGQAVEASCKIRQTADGRYALRHFAPALHFKNNTSENVVLEIEKFGQDRPVEAVLVGGQKIAFEICSGIIKYSLQVGIGEELNALVVYRRSPRTQRNLSWKYRLAASLRRTLSDLRDTQIARSKCLLSLAEKAKDLLATRRTSSRKPR